MQSNIRKLRNERQISQTELADIIGKTQQTVSHMERDRDRISIESLITMADYFGVSTDCVLGIEQEENNNSDKNKDDSSDKGTLLKEAENIKRNFNGDNTKVLYQLILSLLLCSLEEEMANV